MMSELTREAFASTTMAKSDQINASDLLGGPLVCVITDVQMTGSAEQPISIYVDAHPQPWKPSKTSRRVLLACWPDDPSLWIGRTIVLYNDTSVMWAGKAEGGIRCSHVSNIDRTIRVSTQASKGKKVPQVVDPYYAPEQTQKQPASPVYWPDNKFEERLTAAADAIREGKSTIDDVVAKLESKALLTVGQKARLASESQPKQQAEQQEAPALDPEDDDIPY